MQEGSGILADSIKEAIKNGKTEDAIAIYTQMISQGMAMKFNFLGVAEDSNKEQVE